MEDLARRSEEICGLFTSAPMPGDISRDLAAGMDKLGARSVAVRSSALVEDNSQATWAGQFESYLNTSIETLEQNVKRCWASLFSPRAIFYSVQTGTPTSHSPMGVVVQRM